MPPRAPISRSPRWPDSHHDRLSGSTGSPGSVMQRVSCRRRGTTRRSFIARYSTAHQLRRGFSALLAANLPEPVPALIGENLDSFRGADARWLAHESASSCSEAASSESLAAPAASPEIPLEATRWPLRYLRPNPLNPRVELDSTGI